MRIASGVMPKSAADWDDVGTSNANLSNGSNQLPLLSGGR
jgi:hypothetical protein